MNVLWFVLLILRWPCAIASFVSLWAAYFAASNTVTLFVLAGFGIAMLIVFLFSFPPIDMPEAHEEPEEFPGQLSRLDRLDGVGNRTRKDQS